LAKLIHEGRIDFLKQWRSLKLPEMVSCFTEPGNPATFERCKLDFEDVKRHANIYALHRDLLRLRRQDPVISKQASDGIDGAVLSAHCFLIRYFSPGNVRDRLLLVNLGTDLEFNPAPEPLLAPPPDMLWEKLWSTDDPEYGGCGTPPLDTEENWQLPGEAAVLLHPVPGGSTKDSKHKR
jgi:maltooligosyltrehalose trehalohydrolase